jgi:hypothetical protein
MFRGARCGNPHVPICGAPGEQSLKPPRNSFYEQTSTSAGDRGQMCSTTARERALRSRAGRIPKPCCPTPSERKAPWESTRPWA